MAAPEQQLVWGASRPAVWGGTAEGCLGKGRAAAPALSFMIFPISELSKGSKTLPKPARGVLQLLWVLLAQEELAEQVADGAKCEISKPQKIKKLCKHQ